jgi:hypothetical protein
MVAPHLFFPFGHDDSKYVCYLFGTYEELPGMKNTHDALAIQGQLM